MINLKATPKLKIKQQPRPYTCPFVQVVGVFIPIRKDAKILLAEMEFMTEYDSRWPGSGRSTSSSNVFTLDVNTVPPRWVIGRPMQ